MLPSQLRLSIGSPKLKVPLLHSSWLQLIDTISNAISFPFFPTLSALRVALK